MNWTVMVVDDEVLTRDLFRLMLERAGFRVTEAVDGRDALKQIRFELPDLVILDVMMPHIDGYEVCRRLRLQEETATLPILMLSAKTQPEDAEEGMRAGATRYLPKPITYKELIQNITEILESESSEQQS